MMRLWLALLPLQLCAQELAVVRSVAGDLVESFSPHGFTCAMCFERPGAGTAILPAGS